MDLDRFVDLYASEAEQHLRLLQRSLLQLEGTDAGPAVDEAFRAAHTLKGISAAMGHAAVAAIAHRLEDRLEEARTAGGRTDAELVDVLLAEADALEAAVAAAIADPAPPAPAAQEHPEAAAAPGQTPVDEPLSVPPPAGTAAIALVRLREDAPLKSVRALLVLRALEGVAPVLGSAPSEFDEGFAGGFRIFLGAGTDTAAVRAAIEAAGDVAAVDLMAADGAVEMAATPHVASAPGGRAAGSAARGRQLRVDADRVNRIAESIGELSVLHGRITDPEADPSAAAEMMARTGVLLRELQHAVLALRMVPVRGVFERLPRVVRDVARTLDRVAEVVIEGDDVELDRAILEEIGEPLVHLVRNAIDHGIEPAEDRRAAGKRPAGQIRLRAERERNSVRITVTDDGRGVAAAAVAAKAKAAGLLEPDASERLSDEDLFRLLSHPGLSTASEVSAISGRGVGIDVVASRVRALGGAIEMSTEPGQGTTFAIRLPVTLALVQALRVRVGGEDYAIPLTHISEATELNGNARRTRGGETLRLRGETLPVVRLRRVLLIDEGGAERTAVIAGMGDRRAALAVDELVGREQIIVKSIDLAAGTLPCFTGATLLGDGRPALVLDPLSVM